MKLVYSYSHNDGDMRDEMEKHLAVLKRNGHIADWSDRRIVPGQDFQESIDRNIDSADIIVLLISADFFQSEACIQEMTKSLELEKTRRTIVLPVIVRPCDWKSSAIAHLLLLPTDGEPITTWDDRDSAFLDVVNGIRKVIESHVSQVKVRPDFLSALSAIEFVSHNKADISIDDIFITPHIVHTSSDTDTTIDDFYAFVQDRKHVIVDGDERSGKTTIARKLFLDCVKTGRPTIILSGRDLAPALQHEDLVFRKFSEQFDGSFQQWQQQQDKTVIIDDLDASSHISFISFARRYFDYILITVSDDEYLAFFKDEKQLANFQLVSIRPMKRFQQEKLIRRWTSLRDNGLTENVADGAIDRLEERVNSIVLHRKIVPRFPFYVLSILQTYELFMPQGLQITAYGHCYQALITAQMIGAGIQGEDIDSALNFLSHLAFFVFQNDREEAPHTYDEFVRRYRADYVIRESILSRLTAGRKALLRGDGGGYAFRYSFMYYFLLGYYFARNRSDTARYIDGILEKSYLRDNMFIAVFSIHHTTDEELLGRILKYTTNALSTTDVATLDTSETRLLEVALVEVPDDVISRRSIEEERQRQRDQRDDVDDSSAYSDEHDTDSVFLNDVYRALKNMEILGQILRNKVGSLKKDRLEEIITTVVDAGLRLVRIITSKESILSFEEFLLARLEEVSLDRSRERVHEMMRRQFRALVTLSMYMVLKKTAGSIGKAELAKIVREIVRSRATTAYELVGTLFSFHTVESIDEQWVDRIVRSLKGYKKDGNEVARRVVSLETQMYLNTHRVKPGLRQRLYRELGLVYRPNRASVHD